MNKPILSLCTGAFDELPSEERAKLVEFSAECVLALMHYRKTPTGFQPR